MVKKLFDDDDDVNSNGDEPEIKINEEYAKRLEHNKKREDLHRYEELKKKGLINESDDDESDEESDGDDVVEEARKRDLEFIDVLIKVKNKDPCLKQKDVKLFASDESEEERDENELNGESSKKHKKKAMYLKDVVARHLIEDGSELGENDGRIEKKSYMEEQEEIKKEFLDVAGEVENDGDDFLRQKTKDSEDEHEDNDEEFVQKLDEYFGADGEPDQNKLFLKEFFMNKMWIDKGSKDKKVVLEDEEVDVLSMDEEELEKQEEFETNFRYEENANDRVMGYSRIVDDSVRKKDNARKQQRKNKEERKKIEELERMEERKRLKNLKKQEIAEKMKKVMDIAGIKEEDQFLLKAKDLDKEFDPEEYDKLMNALYNEEYYGADDPNPSFVKDGDDDYDDAEKPDFEKEDELLGLPKGWDVLESSGGFLAAREKSLKEKSEETSSDEEDEEGNDEEMEEEEEEEEEEKQEVSTESKQKRKRKMSLVKRAREEMMEEYYKLDYEDTIGDLKTRFNYAKVKPNKYGLSTAEILMMDDSDLKQYVSLKKLAPFREDEFTVDKRKKHQQKLKNMELFQGSKSDHVKKIGHKKKLKVSADKSTSEIVNKDGTVPVDSSKDETNILSARAKRRHRQAGPKLTQSRSMAYGLTQPKTKGKGKH